MFLFDAPPREPRISKSVVEIYSPSLSHRLVCGQSISLYHHLQTPGAWAKHRRDQIEIVLLFAPAVGEISWLETSGLWNTCRLRGPQVCVVAAGQIHECRLECEAELLVLYVERQFLQKSTLRNIKGVIVADHAQHDLVIWMLASVLRRLRTTGSRPDSAMVDFVGGGLARWLIERLAETQVLSRPMCRKLSLSQRERVMQYMQANMKHDIHVIDLAKQVNMGPAHFTELFKNTTNRSPYQYLKEIRMLKAHELLLTGDLLLKEVGVSVGYINSDHFGELFKKHFGYSGRSLLRRIRGGSH